MLLLAGGAWYVTRPKPAASAQGLVVSTSNTAIPAHNLRDALPAPREGLIAIARDPQVLLAASGSLGLVTRIRENLGCLTPVQYDTLLKPAIDAFALYVQMLPASESHHHANPGGLLVHLLESASTASKLTQSYKLPKGAATEDQHKYKPQWALGITICALLHDVGKPIANLGIVLHSASRQLQSWDGLSGAMTQYQQATHYSVAFEYAPYESHTRLPVILLQSLVGEQTRQWLEQAPGLLPAMMGYLDGQANESDAIKEIVTLADQHSTKTNLATGPKSRFASARAVPAIERMLGGLRGAIADEELAMNRAGAAGFVDTDGEHVYFVAGVVVDAARKWLETKETRQTGAAGLPKDNSRWFDTLQEHGALVPHPSGGSIWPVQVSIPKPDGSDWEMRLTTLKFRVTTVFADNNRPAPLMGTITPELLVKTKATAEGIQATGITTAIVTDVMPVTASPSATTQGVVASFTAALAASPSATTQGVVASFTAALAAMPVATTAPTREAAPKPSKAPPPTLAFVNPHDNAAAQEPVHAPTLLVTNDPQADYEAFERMMGMATAPTATPAVATETAASTPEALVATAETGSDEDDGEFLSPAVSARMDAIVPQRSVLAAPPVRAADEHTGSGVRGLKELDPAVNQFFLWLQNGISRGEIVLNQPIGIAHVVAEGLALLTPRVFSDFVEQNPHLLALLEPNTAELGKETQKTDKTPNRRLQRRLENSGYLLISTTKSKIHTYTAKIGGSKMSMIILGQPQRFFHGLPPENKRITRISAPIVAI
jgi:Putative helicase/Putative conjugal transfer nickase/helicase TraI C-term